MVTMGILPYQGQIPHGTAGNGTRDLMISSQKRRPLDHKFGHIYLRIHTKYKRALSGQKVWYVSD
jgi:hypothetical protein